MLECEALAAVAPHFFTTRAIAPASPHAGTVDGWSQIAAEAGVSLGQLCRLDQVHGSAVHRVRRGGGLSYAVELPVGDVVVSDDPTVAISVRAADCAPLLVADRRQGVVAAAHAGWRGAASHVARTAVEALAQAYGSRAGDLLAAIGPSIGRCCYQVGPEVRAAFAAAGHAGQALDRWFSPDLGDRLRLDLWAAMRDQLEAAGVPGGSVHLAGLCTATHVDRFFSYRVEGAAAGRLVAVIRATDRSVAVRGSEPSAVPVRS